MGRIWVLLLLPLKGSTVTRWWPIVLDLGRNLLIRYGGQPFRTGVPMGQVKVNILYSKGGGSSVGTGNGVQQ